MSRPSSRTPKSGLTARDAGEEPAPESESEALEGLASGVLRFGRFGRDALGVALLAGALLTLFGLLELTQGAFLSPWIGFLSRWLGWGRWAVPPVMGLAGLRLLWRREEQPGHFPLGPVLAWEGVYFTLLALFAAVGGTSLERAREGLDGGRVGWGLATLLEIVLPRALVLLLLGVLLVLFVAAALGIFERLAKWAERVAPEEPQDAPEPLPTTGAAVQPPLPEVDVEPLLEAVGPQERNRRLPPLNLLLREVIQRPDQGMIHRTAKRLEDTLAEFGVPARVTGYRIGPTVTQYAVEPGYLEKVNPDGEVQRQKVRVSQISALARDLALSLSAERLRIEAPVPGQSFVGIEVPNSSSSIVRLRPILESANFQRLNSPLAIGLGQDVSGQPVVADLGRMPHMLIAGTTGSGKSVCIAALTTCLVVNNTPEDLRLIMLDPKMVELVRFNGLPHILGKVETQLERMLAALKWVLMEMDRRYRLLEDAHTRDLQTYNRKMERRGQPRLPRIVLLVDELADLMMSAPEQTEHNLVRLAQMARATGIHLVVATQRPSTDVVTGLIKANFPARISFTVASSIDSRVILDTNGAETLLGRGDMLFLNPEEGTPLRAQGAFVADEEVERIITFWKKSLAAGKGPTPSEESPWEDLVEASGDENSDALVEQATRIVRQTQRASASMLQRRLRIGYPRAARLMDELEDLGVVGPVQAGGREREVLLPPEDADEEEDADAEDDED